MKVFVAILLAMLLIAIVGLFVALPVMLLWNAVVPAVFGLQAITYLQSYALYFLCYLLFGHSSVKAKD